jgi:hypothetical protein
MIGLAHALSLALAPQGAGGQAVAPAVPANFAVESKTDTVITLTWDDVPAGVTVRSQAQPSGGDWSEPEDAYPVTPGFEVTGCAANSMYDVRVRAEKDGLFSVWATYEGVYTLPAAPTGLTAAAGGYGNVLLNWDAQSEATGFNVYQLDGTLVAAGVTDTTYTDVIGTTGGYYTYKITAVSAGGESPPSETAEGPAGPGAAPVNIDTPGITDYLGSLGVSALGNWSGDPASFSYTYQWQFAGSDCPGETGPTIITGGDTSDYYQCVVTASNVVGSGSATSNQIYGTRYV